MRRLDMDVGLLVFTFVLIVVSLLALSFLHGPDRALEAFITWGGVIVGAIAGLIRGSSKPPQE